MSVQILIGDCRARMAELPDASVDSVVCDPPYHLTSIVKRFGAANAAPAKVGKTGAFARVSKGFMGQAWDGGDVAFDPETWAEVLRVLKPGGHLVAFSGTRTYHRMAVAIEGAGFEIRDQLAWVYGSGFPKSLDVSKAIDKASGAKREVVGVKTEPNGRNRLKEARGVVDRNTWGDKGSGFRESEEKRLLTAPATEAAQQWQGWGTALKPSWEPICLARKPLIGSVAQNVLTHGTGALNIDGCRVSTEGEEFSVPQSDPQKRSGVVGGDLGISKADAEKFQAAQRASIERTAQLGRWPANLCHDGSEEVLAGFPAEAGGGGRDSRGRVHQAMHGDPRKSERDDVHPGFGDSGSAARFFYCGKATTEERGEGNNHPTVKPKGLMEWLVKLVTPKGGTVLDPFMGSGSTLLAADALQFNAIGCELSPEYAAIAEKRIREAAGMFADVTISTPPAEEAAA